uniref:Ig-like domain-containing protein n=1 Tax=Myripristis murdjan TaxID=586833 RepID=A0A667ZEF2_9TELE
MNAASVISCCLLAASLSISPNRLQFFTYDTIKLTCNVSGNSTGWMVRRNTTSQIDVPCMKPWGIPNGPSCTIEEAYAKDSGLYWCESRDVGCSNAVNITVTGKTVSPALPVSEGDDVTLHYGAFDDDMSAGKITLHAVSKSDEGLYSCEHPTKGKSPESRLAVTVQKFFFFFFFFPDAYIDNKFNLLTSKHFFFLLILQHIYNLEVIN